MLSATLWLLSLSSCQTKRNTAATRAWKAFHARYNTYYNGATAYVEGALLKENAHKDDFTCLLPMYTVENKTTRETGAAEMEKAVNKAKKAVQLYSIKKRPQWDPGKRKTHKDIEWLGRREYNPMLWKAWMLMGRALYYQGKYEEAVSTFAHMQRLYHTQGAIRDKASAWQAKACNRLGWLYETDDLIRSTQKRGMATEAEAEWHYTLADYYIQLSDYQQAIPHLMQAIKHEKRRKQKARLAFLLGQLYQMVGQNESACMAFKQVVKLNPPYELAFNAGVHLAELSKKNKDEALRRLKRMTRSDKNNEYQDVIYFAMGNILLQKRDTLRAIYTYEEGMKRAIRSGMDKALLTLTLADLYWKKNEFDKAKNNYEEALKILPKEHQRHLEATQRLEVLTRLVPPWQEVILQDSLQALSVLPEGQLNKILDAIIKERKRQDKLENNNQQSANTLAPDGSPSFGLPQGGVDHSTLAAQKKADWYFNDPMRVQKGREKFKKVWGNRANKDNWRIASHTSNSLNKKTKTLIAGDSLRVEDEQEIDEPTTESTNNPYQRSFYLAQIPFTAEQKQSSDQRIMQGLLQSAVILKDEMYRYNLSEKHLLRLVKQYPTFTDIDQAYYHLYLLYARINDTHNADKYKNLLIKGCPSSPLTSLVSDPLYRKKAIFGREMEDSIYTKAYGAFKKGQYEEVLAQEKVSQKDFANGANRDKFMFISALSSLNLGQKDQCIKKLEKLKENYPQSQLVSMTESIVTGLSQGKRTYEVNLDFASGEKKRAEHQKLHKSIVGDTLSADREVPFVVQLIYKNDSLDHNRFLFEVAKFNFEHYPVRNFDLAFEQSGERPMLEISGFKNHQEALLYVRDIYRQKSITPLMASIRTIIVSKINAPLLGTAYTYDAYQEFYDKKLSHFDIKDPQILMIPEQILTEEEKQAERYPEQKIPQKDGFMEIKIQDSSQHKDQNNPKPVLTNKQNQPQKTDVIDIPIENKVEKKQQKSTNKDKNATVIQVKDKTDAKQNKKETTLQQKQKKAKNNEPEIYFDDGFGTEPHEEKTTKEKKKKKSGIDLEDEYYDLEGF